nr:HAD hydrolase family protein [Deinococcus arboris]
MRPATVTAALEALHPAERRPDRGKTVLVTRQASLRTSDPDFETAWPLAQGLLKLIHGQPDTARLDALAEVWAALPQAQVIRERADRVVLVAPGADKGSALQTLRRRLGVSQARILAAGDGSADAAMGPQAGLLVRVGAHPALSAAHQTVPDPAALVQLLRFCRRTGAPPQPNALSCRA